MSAAYRWRSNIITINTNWQTSTTTRLCNKPLRARESTRRIKFNNEDLTRLSGLATTFKAVSAFLGQFSMLDSRGFSFHNLHKGSRTATWHIELMHTVQCIGSIMETFLKMFRREEIHCNKPFYVGTFFFIYHDSLYISICRRRSRISKVCTLPTRVTLYQVEV